MKVSKVSLNFFAAIMAGISSCGVAVCAADGTSAISNSASTVSNSVSTASNSETRAVLDRQRIISSLQLDDAVFLSAFNRPVNLPEQPGQPDSLSASTNLSLASASLLPLLNAPSDLYKLLRRNELVQIITDIEIDNSKPLTKNIIVSLKNDAPELVRLARNSLKQKVGHNHGLVDSPMQWQGEGSNWQATVLDARHLLVSNKPESAAKIEGKFAQGKDKKDGKNRKDSGSDSGSANSAADSALSTFEVLPKRLKILLADLPGEPDLWQVLDTSIINSTNGDRASNSFCELSKDKTSMVTFVEPGSETLKSLVYSVNQKAPDQISRELSDFKEPAEFVVRKSGENKFTVTIPGADPKSMRTKVFLLLLTGPLGAG